MPEKIRVEKTKTQEAQAHLDSLLKRQQDGESAEKILNEIKSEQAKEDALRVEKEKQEQIKAQERQLADELQKQVDRNNEIEAIRKDIETHNHYSTLLFESQKKIITKVLEHQIQWIQDLKQQPFFNNTGLRQLLSKTQQAIVSTLTYNSRFPYTKEEIEEHTNSNVLRKKVLQALDGFAEYQKFQNFILTNTPLHQIHSGSTRNKVDEEYPHFQAHEKVETLLNELRDIVVEKAKETP